METTIYSVKQFNDYVAKVLKAEIGEVTIKGEVSGLKIKGQHIYFDIKDDDSVLNCYMPAFRLDFPIEDGQELLVTGTPGIYVPYGKYSLTVRTIELQGEGALKKAYEEMKAKLDQEGLFHPKHKRPLPRFPETIGIITSGEGAAVNDILKVINRRWGGLQIFLVPVLVQGKNAPDELVAAITYFNEHHHVDVIIFGRGGGSLEDLQAFNSERVARAIFSSRIPIVAGIGHEHNISIADLVADIRAATPSNAAEITVPDRRAIAGEIELLRQRAEQHVAQKIMRSAHELQQQKQTLQLFISGRMGEIRLLIQGLGQKLSERKQEVLQCRAAVVRMRGELGHRMNAELERATTRTIEGRKLLYVLSPKAILNRGYSITYQANSGKPIVTMKDVPSGGKIRTQISDGSFDAITISQEQPKPISSSKSTTVRIVTPSKEEQSTLF